MRPSWTTAMASRSATVESRWATMIVVSFFSAISRVRVSCTTASDSLSRALVASSRSNILGELTRARAIATRCFCPPLRRPPAVPTSVAYPSGSSEMKPWAFACLAAASISLSDTSPGRPSAMLSRMVPRKSTGSCPTKPTSSWSQPRSRSRTSTPPHRTLPLSES
mmetsp:Transcript_29454/g.85871  ORF Transcript_29454/g.85871 Transcript_29454/m.85871 type:complete len:166 (-) Transcript_29454:3473-3970(-)